ncbi:hypothetical protein B0H14DRAFT_2633037 [Mycena olivaceomarginata]|nr:hypothetical protein B0H14DRAFT_2633037 [Mycena olivaceomarginata]
MANATMPSGTRGVVLAVKTWMSAATFELKETKNVETEHGKDIWGIQNEEAVWMSAEIRAWMGLKTKCEQMKTKGVTWLSSVDAGPPTVRPRTEVLRPTSNPDLYTGERDRTTSQRTILFKIWVGNVLDGEKRAEEQKMWAWPEAEVDTTSGEFC